VVVFTVNKNNEIFLTNQKISRTKPLRGGTKREKKSIAQKGEKQRKKTDKKSVKADFLC